MAELSLDPAGHPAESVTLTGEVDTKGTSLPYEQLTAADAVFLRIETPHEPQHVGSLSVIEGGPLRDASGRIRFDELLAHVDRRVHRVPRLRQRVMEVPYNLSLIHI